MLPVMFVISSTVMAQEKLPSPTPAPATVKIYNFKVAPRYAKPSLPPGVTIRHRSAYDRWNYYATDRWGNWRAKVVPIPGTMDGYHRYNGELYPWMTVHPEIYPQGYPRR